MDEPGKKYDEMATFVVRNKHFIAKGFGRSEIFVCRSRRGLILKRDRHVVTRFASEVPISVAISINSQIQLIKTPRF